MLEDLEVRWNFVCLLASDTREKIIVFIVSDLEFQIWLMCLY